MHINLNQQQSIGLYKYIIRVGGKNKFRGSLERKKDFSMTGLVKKLLFCGAKGLATTELPVGRIWVCVGRDDKAQRFELEATYLNHPLFEDLLRLSVPEFGYSYEGALRIACETDLFLHLLDLLRSSNPSVHYMDLQDLMNKFYASAGQHDKPHH